MALFELKIGGSLKVSFVKTGEYSLWEFNTIDLSHTFFKVKPSFKMLVGFGKILKKHDQ